MNSFFRVHRVACDHVAPIYSEFYEMSLCSFQYFFTHKSHVGIFFFTDTTAVHKTHCKAGMDSFIG